MRVRSRRSGVTITPGDECYLLCISLVEYVTPKTGTKLALLFRKPLTFFLSRQHRFKIFSHPCTFIMNWTLYDPMSQVLHLVFRICNWKRKEILRDLNTRDSTQDSPLVPNINLWWTRLNSDATTSHHLLNPIYTIHTLPNCDMLPLLLQYSWFLPVPPLFSKMLTTLSSVSCLARNVSWKAGSDCRVTRYYT